MNSDGSDFTMLLSLSCAFLMLLEQHQLAFDQKPQTSIQAEKSVRITTLQIWTEMKMNVENVRFLHLGCQPLPFHSIFYHATYTHLICTYFAFRCCTFVLCLANANIHSLHACISCIRFGKIEKAYFKIRHIACII